MNERTNLFIGKGNVGSKEMRESASGLSILKLSQAIKMRVKQGEEWEDDTQWVRWTAFGKLAERIDEYADVGDYIEVEGYYQSRQFEGDDGEKRTYHEFIVRSWQPLRRKGSGGGNGKDYKAKSSEKKGRKNEGMEDIDPRFEL